MSDGWEQAQLGMEIVLEHEKQLWRDRAWAILRYNVQQLDDHERFTPDHIRFWWKDAGLPEPHHPNAYGAIMRKARKAGVVVPTGTMRPSVRTSRHGSLIPEYVPGPASRR